MLLFSNVLGSMLQVVFLLAIALHVGFLMIMF